MLTVRSEIGPYQKPSRDFTEKPPAGPKRRPLGKRGCACELLFIPGEQEHEHEARKNIDNYFFKVIAKRLNLSGIVQQATGLRDVTFQMASRAHHRRRVERNTAFTDLLPSMGCPSANR